MFTGIDSLRSWNVARLGVRNLLQTKRDYTSYSEDEDNQFRTATESSVQSYSWAGLNTYVDFFFDDPAFNNELDRDFSNLYNELFWRPVPWLSFWADAQFPIGGGGAEFTESNYGVTWLPNKNLSFTVGHQFITVVAVEAGPAVGTDLETHPGPPAGCPAGADGLGRAGPGEPAEALQLIGHHLALDRAQRARIRERHVAAARTVDAGDRAQRCDPVGRGLQDLDGLVVLHEAEAELEDRERHADVQQRGDEPDGGGCSERRQVVLVHLVA